MIDAQPPTYPQLNLNIQPNGMTVSVIAGPGILSSQVTIGEDMMHQVCRTWLETHDALMNELVRDSIAAKKNQLALIKHVRESRIN